MLRNAQDKRARKLAKKRVRLLSIPFLAFVWPGAASWNILEMDDMVKVFEDCVRMVLHGLGELISQTKVDFGGLLERPMQHLLISMTEACAPTP